MASLSNLVTAATASPSRRARAGNGGAWLADVVTDIHRDTTYKPRRLVVMHHVTVMLGVGLDPDNRAIADDRFMVSLGHRSVSDQNGMNKLFRQLGIPFRYDREYRSGGPRYTWLEQLDPAHVWADALTPRVNASGNVTWNSSVVITGLPTYVVRQYGDYKYT